MYEQHRFGVQLMHLSRAWRAELDRRLADKGLSQARWLVLLHLGRFNMAPAQRELADSIGIEGPTLARTLDALERQGLISRQACATDRRINRIHLTENATELVTSIEAIAQQLREEVMFGLTPEELQLCQRVHVRMLKNLEVSSRLFGL